MNISDDPVAFVRECYAAAIRSVDPESAMQRALEHSPVSNKPTWIIAVGKAAPKMALALTDWIHATGQQLSGGLVISAEQIGGALGTLDCMVGDHPLPGLNSFAAAGALESLIARIGPNDRVHVAISGGTSSLIGAPLPGIDLPDFVEASNILFGSGFPIGKVNWYRRRLCRWSGGRLAMACRKAEISVWVISDVPGDDLATIGSGPCTAEPLLAASAVQQLLNDARQLHLPAATLDLLRNPVLAAADLPPGMISTIVASNGVALAGAAAFATAHGVSATVKSGSLHGESAMVGAQIGTAVRTEQSSSRSITIWGGETTVTLDNSSGMGGRSQELALAASREIAGTNIVILSAGTDGRDGPTDAAGAIVDGSTWHQAGADGAAENDLRNHNSHAALERAGALLRTGPSGTNVMDIVVAATGWN